MFDEDILKPLLACLENIERAIYDQQYEPGPILTVGGATGVYVIKSPFNTECEWTPYAFCALTGRGIVIVNSANPGINTPPGDGSVSFGLVSSGAESNAIEGLVTVQASNNGEVLPQHWMPLGRGGLLYVDISMAAGAQSGYFSAAFRRKLTHIIPDKPRQHPHTHPVPPRRALRMQPAQDEMGAGFEAKYPQPGGPAYTHQPLTPGGNAGRGGGRRGR